MNHPDEEALELFVLESSGVASRRAEIEAHLRECSGCMSLLREIEQYYAEVQSVREERTRSVSQALTVRSMAVKVPTYTEFGPLSQIPKTWPARAVLFVIRHPYSTTAVSTGLLAGVVLTALTLFSPTVTKDLNPSYARAKDEFLVVYNKEGTELWRKYMGIGYDMDRISHEANLKPEEYLDVMDVNGDGRREVISVPVMPSPRNQEVTCYNADGADRWRLQFQRSMIFGTQRFSGRYNFLMMLAGDFEKGRDAEVVVVGTFPDYYPTVFLKVDASTGQVLSEYWSSGNITRVAHRDFDGDGIEELYFAGTNNGTDRAFLVILDPRSMSGRTPAPASHTPLGVAEGTEKFYIEFPRSDLQKVATQKRSLSREIRFLTDSSLSVAVGELIDNSYFLEFYHFDNNMVCTLADWQDETMALYRKLVAEGKLLQVPDAYYYERLRKGVLYWDGEKFVRTATMNKRYLEAIGQVAKR